MGQCDSGGCHGHPRRHAPWWSQCARGTGQIQHFTCCPCNEVSTLPPPCSAAYNSCGWSHYNPFILKGCFTYSFELADSHGITNSNKQCSSSHSPWPYFRKTSIHTRSLPDADSNTPMFPGCMPLPSDFFKISLCKDSGNLKADSLFTFYFPTFDSSAILHFFFTQLSLWLFKLSKVNTDEEFVGAKTLQKNTEVN